MMKWICVLLLPLTVWCYPEFQCPSLPHWDFRAMDICNKTYDYRCLWDYNKRQYVEQCGGTEYQMRGFRRIFSGGTTRSPCSEDRYQPFKYTTHGNYECIFQKSDCTEVGQVVFDNGTRISDRRCACDHSNNFTFMYPPKHQCYCEPGVEDCSCIIKTCPDQYIIDPDYNCRHIRNWSSSFRCEYPSDKLSVVLSTIDKELDQSEGSKTSKSSQTAAASVGLGICICILGIITIAILHTLDRKEAVKKAVKEEEGAVKKDVDGVKEEVKKEVEAVKKDVDAVKEEMDAGKEEVKKEVEAVKEEVKRLVRNDPLEHMREKYQSYIEQWQEDEVTFTVTRATEQVTRLVQENGVVLVTGSSGSGKSSIVHHVALELQSKEKYDVIPIVSSPADIVQYRDLKKNQVFVIDDFCGKNFINEQDVQTWKEQAGKIEQLFLSENKNQKVAKSDKKGITYGRMIILISCRLQISKDAKFESMKMFNKPSVDLQSKNYCLLPKERRNMISKYTTLSEYNLQIMDEMMDKCSFFPLLCKMSKGKQVEQLTELFTSPVDSIKNDIKDMIENKHFEFCALVLCVLFPNELEESYMNPRSTPQIVEEKVTEIVANFRINLKIELERKQLVDTFNKLDGTYIKKTGSVYSIAHDKLYDMVAVTCGQKLVELFIEYSPSSFIAERFKLKSGQNLEQDDSFLYLSDDTEIVYFDRIFRDLKKQDGKSFYNQQLKEKRYKEKVMGYIKEHTDSCKQLFLELDDKGLLDDYKYTSTPMIEASKIGFYELVKYLISIKCNVNKTDSIFRRSPLYYSFKNGHVNIVQLLITNGVNIQDVLCEACYHGDINTVRMCLDRNVDVSQCNSSWLGETPLFGACVGGHIDIVRLLLDRNVDVSQCNSGELGQTPLFGACVGGHIDIVRLLLDRNVDVSQCNSGELGQTPLFGACVGGHIDIVRLLLGRNADVSQCNSGGWGETPLYGACVGGHIDIVRLLLGRNVDVSQCNSGGWGYTPLFGACYWGHIDIVKLLLQNNADPTQRIRSGLTPLGLDWVDESIKQLLRSYIKH